MINYSGKLFFILITAVMVTSSGSAIELAADVDWDSGFSNIPYQQGDTVQGTVDVTWAEGTPDSVIPCDTCDQSQSEIKWKVYLVYKDSSGSQHNTLVGETSYGALDTRREGDITTETVEPVTIENLDQPVDTDAYNGILIKPVLSPPDTSTGYVGNQHDIVHSESTGGNLNPVPLMDVPQTISIGESFSADARESYDSDGTVESYEWDWTGDGTYEGTGDVANNYYQNTGTETVKLRVTDDQGATSTISQDIEVTQDCPDKTVGRIDLPITTDLPYLNYYQTTYDVKAAFWDKSTSGEHTNTLTGCNYNHASPTTETEYENWDFSSSPIDTAEQPMVFDCENGTTNELVSYPSPPDNELSTTEQNYYHDAREGAETYCRQRANYDFETAGETLPMVQYYIPIRSIPVGSPGSSYVSTSGDYRGLITHTYSDLYRAMVRYDQGDNIWSCEDCENETTWQQKNMSQTSAYSNPNPEKDGYQDAWVVDNMGGGNDPNIQDNNPFQFTATGGSNKRPEDSKIFPGGFGGNCQGIATWQYDRDLTEWRCDSNVPVTQEIFMPTIDFPGDQEADMVRVGFFMMPQLFTTDGPSLSDPRDLPDSLRGSTSEALGEGQNITEVNAMCWWGDSDRFRDLQQENAGQTWFTVSYRDMPTDFSNPVPVQGELNRTLESEYGGGYSCRWTLSAEPAVKFSEENVEPDSDALSADVYTGSGTVERVGPNIQTLVEERGYTSDAISLEDDFSSPMNEDKFADVSYEWQDEIGYERYDTAIESDQRLNCKPNQPPYSGADQVNTCTIFNFHDWSDLFTIYK